MSLNFLIFFIRLVSKSLLASGRFIFSIVGNLLRFIPCVLSVNVETMSNIYDGEGNSK